MADRAGVGSSAFLFQVGDELDGADFGGTGDGTGGEDGAEGVKSVA